MSADDARRGALKPIMDAAAVERALRRMATQVAEDLASRGEIALVGIRAGGVPVARRLARLVAEAEGGPPPPIGEVDITLYRDDLYTGLEKPVLGETRIPFPVEGARIVLVDDVLFTGRTVRAALDELMDYGRPRLVRLAVLVDRGHRELPIQADYVGRRLETEISDRVVVVHGGDGDRDPEARVELDRAGRGRP